MSRINTLRVFKFFIFVVCWIFVGWFIEEAVPNKKYAIQLAMILAVILAQLLPINERNGSDE